MKIRGFYDRLISLVELPIPVRRYRYIESEHLFSTQYTHGPVKIFQHHHIVVSLRNIVLVIVIYTGSSNGLLSVGSKPFRDPK